MKAVDETHSAGDPDSFMIKCLLKTVRFMWQVSALPSKIGETLGELYRYAQDSVDSILCLAGKARRKERDGDQNSTDTKLYLEESVLERKLPDADLKALVDLPAGLDYNEWLASHTLALFEHVNLVYGTISEFCTPSGCPDMTGPGNRTYLWFDEKGKKTRVAAPQYIDYVMTFTQKTVSDESIFPTKYANEFPSSFESIARKILRLQFHVIAHLYAAHFREIALLGLHTHLNLTFAHLTALHRRFNLIDEKETDVLRDLEVALRLTDDSSGSNNIATNQPQHTAAASDGVGGAAIMPDGATMPHYNNLGGGGTVGVGGSQDDVNLLNSSTTTTTTTLIDGDAVAPPICTQPEAATKAGGGGGLIGGILGTTGEFGDTTRYCTSAIPSSTAAGAMAPPACGVNCSAAGTATAAACNTTGVALTDVSANGGAGGIGALHLNFTNNNNNQHHTHPHHHQQRHHHYHHLNNYQQQQHQQQQHPNSGLIQCNASAAPVAGTNVLSAAASVIAANNSASNNAATTTTA